MVHLRHSVHQRRSVQFVLLHRSLSDASLIVRARRALAVTALWWRRSACSSSSLAGGVLHAALVVTVHVDLQVEANGYSLVPNFSSTKETDDLEGMQQEILRQVPLNTYGNSSPCKICVDFHSRINSPDIDTKPPQMGTWIMFAYTSFLNPHNKCQNTTRSVMIWTMTVSIIRLPLYTTTMEIE